MEDIKKEIDQLAKFDVHQAGFNDKLKEIHRLLDIQSNQMQNNLSSIISARSRTDHPNIPLHSKLKYLPTDHSGTIIDRPLYLVNDQDRPISDQLQLIRLPIPSDRFAISMDQSELTIIDQNQMPVSEPITFQQSSSIPIKFDYVDDDQRSVRLIETSSSPELITLNVKSTPVDPFSTSKSHLDMTNR